MKAQIALGRAFLALGHTWRVEWHGMEHLDAARRASPAGNVIYAFWHSALTILAHTHRDRDVQVLVSQHRDGEIIARILGSMGYGLVRGSSRRGGMEALFGLAKHLERGRDVAVSVDGPMGPRYCVHPGVLLLSRRTGCPIVPIVASARHCKFLDSWDAQRLPYPLTRVRVRHAEPIRVPEGRDASALAEVHQTLQRRLGDETRAEEAVHGRTIDLRDLQDRRSYWERVSERHDPPWALRALAAVHQGLRRVDRIVRPRPGGRGARPWVVGVGNLEAGGTGKTPCVLALARGALDRGLRVGVLTRGHGGTLGRAHPAVYAHEERARAADETRFLAETLPANVVLVVSRNKRRGLALLSARGDLDVVLVDDAFQTPGLPVDRHVVLLDWENPLANGHLLPAGRLRESPQALRRAHALVFTRARGRGLPRHPAWAHLPAERCFRAVERVQGVTTLAGDPVDPQTLRGRAVALLCGLGRPQAFERSAEGWAAQAGCAIRRIVRIGDHAPLEPALGKLAAKLDGIGCDAVLTTRKDASRLHPAPANDEPLLVLEQRLEVDAWEELLDVLVPRSSPRRRSSRSSPTAKPARGFPRPT